MTPHLNRLVETVQMRGHNICFSAELTEIIPNYPQILPLIYSSSHHDQGNYDQLIQKETPDQDVLTDNLTPKGNLNHYRY